MRSHNIFLIKTAHPAVGGGGGHHTIQMTFQHKKKSVCTEGALTLELLKTRGAVQAEVKNRAGAAEG